MKLLRRKRIKAFVVRFPGIPPHYACAGEELIIPLREKKADQ